MGQFNIKFKKNEDPRIQEFVQHQANLSESLRRLILLHVTKYGTGDIFDVLLGTERHTLPESSSINTPQARQTIPDCYQD